MMKLWTTDAENESSISEITYTQNKMRVWRIHVSEIEISLPTNPSSSLAQTKVGEEKCIIPE